MIKLHSVTSLALAGAMAVVSTAAMADGGPRRGLKDAPYVVPFSWTGFYVGAAIGYGWNDTTTSLSANDPNMAALLSGTAFAGGTPLGGGSVDQSGIFGGLQAGYNWQLGRTWVVGIEADLMGSDMDGRGSSQSILQGAPLVNQRANYQQEIEWFGTVRARLGWLPTDTLMIYATGGLAYGQVNSSGTWAVDVAGARTAGGFSVICPLGGFAVCMAGSSSETSTGWTVGGGAEFALSRNITVKAEYLYVNLGSTSTNVTAWNFAPGNAPSSFRVNFGDAEIHTVRAGVNYKF